MAAFTVDEGLSVLIAAWKKKHKGAVVYTIGDDNHSTDPNKSQHAPDWGTSGKPGDTKGEVDAGDFMPGKGGVGFDDLEDLAEQLRLSRDPRILIVIVGRRMFSSYAINGYPAWTWRPYSGNYHGHLHVSVNDNFKSNKSPWRMEKPVARKIEYKAIEGAKLPELEFGDDDRAQDGWNHVGRMQALLNFQKPKNPIEVDGNYGAKTKAKVREVFPGTDGNRVPLASMRSLYGV